MSEACDILVIGGGPAGVEAAMTAAAQGLAVTLVDEAPAAGGQVYRASPKGFRSGHASPDSRRGDALRASLAASRVKAVFDHAIWSASPGFRVDALGPAGPRAFTARAVIVATGAQERVVPFPGWTQPGILGLAGATILLKSQHMLPGRRTLVAGCGPLLFAVAAGLLDAGSEVAAVVDLAARREWLATLPAMLRRPDLSGRGLGWLGRLGAARVPLLSRHTIRRADPVPGGRIAVQVGPVEIDGRPVRDAATRRFEVDAVAVGHGLAPSSDVTRLMRAEHVHDTARGGWRPRVDADGRTSIPGLYVAGDGAGISGAAAAHLDGRLAGWAAAHDLAAFAPADKEQHMAPLRRKAARARRFGHTMAALMTLRPGQVDAIPAETIVCRCEDVTRAELDAAIADGAADVNQLKAWTRCGMGPCQGRVCGDIVGALLAQATGRHAPERPFTGRPPFRPLPLDQLVGEIAYADLELPPPAPL